MNIKSNRTSATRRPITANVQSRSRISVTPRGFNNLTPEQKVFANQLAMNMRKSGSAIMAATNTTNIAAKPDFYELLPLFVQKLILTDVFGTVAMKSRQQLIPYFKVMAENTKGVTKAGDLLSSPFANRQGIDPNFTGNTVKNEQIGVGNASAKDFAIAYTPVLPKSVTIKADNAGVVTTLEDDGNGNIVNGTTVVGYINYSNGAVTLTAAPAANEVLSASYQYDNENVGPRADVNNGGIGYDYGAQMGKIYLGLDEINLVAKAHQLASYWSIYAAFASNTEYGASLGDTAKEAAISELVAEINTAGFEQLAKAASLKPQFDWDASAVLSGAVDPTGYLNMFKLKLGQASADIYQRTGLAKGNRLVVGTNVAQYITMLNGFVADSADESVGPYKLGKVDNFDVFVAPSYDPNKWVMACKSSDIRRNAAIFGEFMPISATDPITLANGSVQQGIASMYDLKVVNPSAVVSGRVLGIF